MKKIYLEKLASKHILVKQRTDKDLKPEEIYPLLYSFADYFGVKITKGYGNLSIEMIDILEETFGDSVPLPFYRGFPNSVRELSPNELLFDQLTHYMATYGMGFWSDDRFKHSRLEADKDLERAVFSEHTELREFEAVTEDEAESMLVTFIEPLFKSSRPLSASEFTLALTFAEDHPGYKPSACASKDTAVKFLLATRDVSTWGEYLELHDVIKVVDELQFSAYGKTNLKKLNLKNQDRKFLTDLIRLLIVNAHGRLDNEIRACLEKRKLWKGLLYHIHFAAVNWSERRFVQQLYDKDTRSAWSFFENALNDGNVDEAVRLLCEFKGPGAVLRNLDYILSRCRTAEQRRNVLETAVLRGSNPLILMQLLQKYGLESPVYELRTFRFVKHGRMKMHTEHDNLRRTTRLPNKVRQEVADALNKALDASLAKKDTFVWIDPSTDWSKFALPIQEATGSSGYGVLAKGTRLPIPNGKKVRVFTYWERVNDIDLSAHGIYDDGHTVEFSWRNTYHWNGSNNSGILFSGDETSGYHGGSEYFDIELDRVQRELPGLHYLVFANNIYTSGVIFKNIMCKAGFMLRDENDSGEVYEPKTVSTAFTINAEGTFAYLFAIDLTTREMVWLNLGMAESSHVAGLSSSRALITSYCRVTEILNYERFFTAIGRTVSRIDDANIVVSDKTLELKEGVTQIHSYDLDAVRALMNP